METDVWNEPWLWPRQEVFGWWRKPEKEKSTKYSAFVWVTVKNKNYYWPWGRMGGGGVMQLLTQLNSDTLTVGVTRPPPRPELWFILPLTPGWEWNLTLTVEPRNVLRFGFWFHSNTAASRFRNLSRFEPCRKQNTATLEPLGVYIYVYIIKVYFPVIFITVYWFTVLKFIMILNIGLVLDFYSCLFIYKSLSQAAPWLWVWDLWFQ